MKIQNLSIILRDSNPVISRRVQVPTIMNLHELHQLIQIAMPWDTSHMHQFHYKNEEYWCEKKDALSDFFDKPDQLTKKWSIERFLQHTKAKSFHYIYDLGDHWDHLIKVGATIDPKPNEIYPKLLAAKGFAPPEDIGGIFHYNWALETLNEPERDDYEDTVAWFDDDFDPNADAFPALEQAVTEFAQRYQSKLQKVKR